MGLFPAYSSFVRGKLLHMDPFGTAEIYIRHTEHEDSPKAFLYLSVPFGLLMCNKNSRKDKLKINLFVHH